MKTLRAVALAILAAAPGLSALGAEPPAAAGASELLLGPAYPLEVRVAFHAALFHWVDSLAGSSGGKTIPAHRKQYLERLGEQTATEARLIVEFRNARARDAYRPDGSPGGDDGSPRGLARLRRTFLESPDLAGALAAAESEMAPEDFAAVRRALEHFGPKYETIWQDGRVPVAFLERFEGDRDRGRLEALLVAIARFFDADLGSLPRPVVVLAPVPAGSGTHATAIGPYLLIEVRPFDRLAQQASVIVHENAHFLFLNMDRSRLAGLETVVARSGSRGRKAWRLLDEALPTALGQGVADRGFRRGSWSKRRPWYHTAEIDRYAKAIYPLVDEALASGRPIDSTFVEKAIELCPE